MVKLYEMVSAFEMMMIIHAITMQYIHLTNKQCNLIDYSIGSVDGEEIETYKNKKKTQKKKLIEGQISEKNPGRMLRLRPAIIQFYWQPSHHRNFIIQAFLTVSCVG